MAGRAVRETVTLAGRADRARVARAFVEGLLGAGHPSGDVAALLVGELFSNSLWHSGSGAPGETVTVAVKTLHGVIRVEVTDRSGPGVPEPRPAGSDAEDGRGLHLVARLAARWGWRRRGGRTVTWFELPHPCVRVPGAHVPPFPVPLWRAGASGWAEPKPETMRRVAAALKRL
jgi:anti-sigma regulatory factor (Ser/Thr protein kinase)